MWGLIAASWRGVLLAMPHVVLTWKESKRVSEREREQEREDRGTWKKEEGKWEKWNKGIGTVGISSLTTIEKIMNKKNLRRHHNCWPTTWRHQHCWLHTQHKERFVLCRWKTEPAPDSSLILISFALFSIPLLKDLQYVRRELPLLREHRFLKMVLYSLETLERFLSNAC